MQALASLFGFTWSSVEEPRAPAASRSRRRPQKRRNTIIPVELKPGGLSRFGYSVENTTRSRHIALLRGMREEGFVPIIQRLNLTATFLKNSSPSKSRIFKTDQRWLSDYYQAVKDREDGPRSRSRRSPSSKLTASVPVSRAKPGIPGGSGALGKRGMGAIASHENDDEFYDYDDDEEYDMSPSATGPEEDDEETEDVDEDEDY